MVLALKTQTKKKATIKPRDAATLILVRFDGPAPRILMGQRHEGHAFMPNKYVFPGGRCEAADGHLPVVNEGEPVTLQKLKLRMGARPSHRKARGTLVAALRETFEETGLLAGRATAGAAPDQLQWRPGPGPRGAGVQEPLDVRPRDTSTGSVLEQMVLPALSVSLRVCPRSSHRAARSAALIGREWMTSGVE